MARSEARVLVEIWDDEDFLALSPAAQRMFLFLISQRDLEHTGVIALRERRWAKKSAGLALEEVSAALAELEGACFIVVDDDAEELLVRSFIRRDKVFKQPNVMRAATDRVDHIESAQIREALLVELDRIRQVEPMSDSAFEIVEEMRDALAKTCRDASRNPSLNPSGNPSGNPSPKGSNVATGEGSAKGCQLRPGEWGMGNGEEPGSQDQEQASADADPGPTAESGGSDAGKSRRLAKEAKLPSSHPKLTWSDKEIDADPEWISFWAAYPKSADKPPARRAWIKALREKEITAPELTSGAERYRDDPTRSAGYTKNAATWLNAESWNNYDYNTVEPQQDPDAFWLN
ncbi:hypothetical protein ACWKSP_26390 [Micromonosporaceae bacterium Da 78-11]